MTKPGTAYARRKKRSEERVLASHAKLYEALCRLRLLIITSAPQLMGRSEYQNSHALKEAEDLIKGGHPWK